MGGGGEGGREGGYGGEGRERAKSGDVFKGEVAEKLSIKKTSEEGFSDQAL